jgi:spore coat polysaccharide biosynthesis protein SpsF (cytidylyltransferase family)
MRMNTIAIIQARLGSSRLPRKVQLPLPTGRTVIEEVVYRARQIEGIDAVVIAVPDDEGDEIQDVIFRSDKLGTGEDLPKVFLIQGPHHDVLARYALAAEAFGAETVMRITADCPLIEPEICADVLRLFRQTPDIDYCSNVHPRTFPTGWDCEVMTSDALMMASLNAGVNDREHVTTFLVENGRRGNLCSMDGDRSHIRWTLDTPEDYRIICDEFCRREVEACV